MRAPPRGPGRRGPLPGREDLLDLRGSEPDAAQGALARTHGIDVDQAFELLRRYARNHNRKLVDLARTVVTDPAQLPELTRSR